MHVKDILEQPRTIDWGGGDTTNFGLGATSPGATALWRLWQLCRVWPRVAPQMDPVALRIQGPDLARLLHPLCCDTHAPTHAHTLARTHTHTHTHTHTQTSLPPFTLVTISFARSRKGPPLVKGRQNLDRPRRWSKDAEPRNNAVSQS